MATLFNLKRYYLVTGKLPFKGKNLYEVFNKIEKGSYIVPLLLSVKLNFGFIFLIKLIFTKVLSFFLQ